MIVYVYSNLTGECLDDLHMALLSVSSNSELSGISGYTAHESWKTPTKSTQVLRKEIMDKDLQ
jgi:hypothetical protein